MKKMTELCNSLILSVGMGVYWIHLAQKMEASTAICLAKRHKMIGSTIGLSNKLIYCLLRRHNNP
jgi:hypothetical protein